MNKIKTNNDLIELILNNEVVGYYTTANAAAKRCGIPQASMFYHLAYTKKWTDKNNNTWAVEIIDGSDIPYKLINIDI